MKYVVRAGLGLVLSLVLVVGLWLGLKDAVWLESAPYGALTVNASLLGKSQQVGEFTVALSTGDKPQLTVRHAGAAKANFESVAGRAFVAAGRSEDVFHEARGMTQVKTKSVAQCPDQTLDSMGLQEGELVLTGTLQCPRGPVGYRLSYKAGQAHNLEFDLRLVELGHSVNDYNRTYLVAASHKDEGFYGFGEQFTYFNQKGRKLPILVSEQGVGRGLQPITLGADLTNDGAGGKWHTSYAGVPHFITTDSKSLVLDSYEYAIFDLRRDDAAVIELAGNHLFGRIVAGTSPTELIENYTAVTGRMRALPEWVTKGAIIGLQGGTAKVRETLAQLNAQQTPLGAFWLQDWVGQRITTFGKQLWWNWTVDNVRYPGWTDLTRDLKKQGIETMTYVNPFLVDVQERAGEQGANYRNLFKEAREQGFLVTTQDGQPYMIKNTSFSAGLLDLTNAKAWNWMKEVIKKEVIGAGSLGWMADFGEGFPMDAVTHGKVNPLVHHNAYAELWAQLNREAIEEAGVGKEATFFSRSGYTRSPQYSTLFWLGDQLVTWDAHDGLKTAVTGLLSSGISGYAFNHSDIGGYTTIRSPLKNYFRSKELQMRWAEVSAFNVVYRTHQGNRPDDNWQFNSDEETLNHFVRMAKVFACWSPYRRELVTQAAEKGLPVVRHPYLHYPQDLKFRNMDHDQFMVGSEFMVAPVLSSGATQVDVYLPEGTWVDLWSGKELSQGAQTWNAPLGKPAVFYRKGAAAGAQMHQCLEAQKLL